MDCCQEDSGKLPFVTREDTAMTTLRLFDMLRRHMRDARSRRARVLSVRALDSLPESLRRDIGWPDRYAGLVADGEWSAPIEIAGPVTEAPGGLRRRPNRAVRTTSVPASGKPVFAHLSVVRKPPVSS
jgi:hypothetical protein